LSSDEFSQAQCENFPKRRRERSEARKRIDSLRVKLWYSFIATASGTGQYALEKELIPQGFARDESGAQIHHRNRMAGYAKGRHVPGRSFVQVVERAYPGSAGLINHPLWKVIDPQNDLAGFRVDGWRQLGTHIQDILRSISSFYNTGNVSARTTQLRRLERDGSLEAAAALAYLLREAREAMDPAFAFSCARSFWQILLILGISPAISHHLQELTDLCGSLLLDHIEAGDERVAIEGAPIVRLNALLRSVSGESNKAASQPSVQKALIRTRLEFMSLGKRRLEFFVAMGMPTIPSASSISESTTYKRCVKEQVARKMAYLYITESRYTGRCFTDDYCVFSDSEGNRWPFTQ
jgi:hypothetical protein